MDTNETLARCITRAKQIRRAINANDNSLDLDQIYEFTYLFLSMNSQISKDPEANLPEKWRFW